MFSLHFLLSFKFHAYMHSSVAITQDHTHAWMCTNLWVTHWSVSILILSVEGIKQQFWPVVVAIPGQKNKVCVAGVYAYMYCLACSKATEECCVCVYIMTFTACSRSWIPSLVYIPCVGEKENQTHERYNMYVILCKCTTCIGTLLA